MIRYLGLAAEGPPEILPTSFASSGRTLTADLLLRTGPGRLVHLEYERRASAYLTIRMLGYRWAIMKRYRTDRLSQHVIVLGQGLIRGHDDPDQEGFMLVLNAVYLRDQDPEPLLAEISLAPLAALGRGRPDQRARYLARAIQLIVQTAGVRSSELLEYAIVLATITLKLSTIVEIVEEADMTVESFAGEILLETKWGRSFRQEAEAQGREQGRATGLEEGREEGREAGREEAREELLAILLRDRFGARPEIEAVAHRLAGGLEPAAAVRAITTAADFDDFLRP